MTIPWITYINLDSSADRREAIERQFNLLNLGVTPVRTNAIQSSMQTSGHPSLTAKEYACLLSHKKAIESIPPGEVGLILEDDALLSPGFKSRFVRLVSLLNDNSSSLSWDVIFLGHTPNFQRITALRSWARMMREFDQRVDNTAFSLINGHHFEWGNFAYLVHPDAKAKIVHVIEANFLANRALPIDDLIGRAIRSNRLRALIVFPSIVGVDPQFGTTISDRRDHNLEMYHAAAANFLVPGLDQAFLQAVFNRRHSGRQDDKPNETNSRICLLADAVHDFIVNEHTPRPRA